MQGWKVSIQSRLERVSDTLTQAAKVSGRPPDAVQIIAISKGQPLEAIRAVLELGLDQIGENRVDEALKKQAELSGAGITWHMVGHIQSRKAADIPGHFSWVHSIDRMKIARKLSRLALDRGVQLRVLLECNVSGESSKGGWDCADRESWPGLVAEFKEITSFTGLQVAGLMTMAPWVRDEAVLRASFRRLRDLRDFMGASLGMALPELSMGMTDDYKLAVEEGATMVRLGRALFGERRE